MEQWESLAVYYAGRYFAGDTRFDFDERKSVAFLGLVKAAKDFDPSRGWSFGTYAGRVMFRELRRESHLAGSQMTRPGLHGDCKHPVAEGKQLSLAPSLEATDRFDPECQVDLRDYAEWVMGMLNERERAVARGIMQGRSHGDIFVPMGRTRHQSRKGSTVKETFTKRLRRQEFDEMLMYVQRRLANAGLQDIANDSVQSG